MLSMTDLLLSGKPGIIMTSQILQDSKKEIEKISNSLNKVEQKIQMDTRRLKSSFYKKCFGPFVFASDQNRFRVLTLPPYELQQK